ncbi:MAG: hypothetical protein LBU89_11900 [Fibromonadaceae bacterium]|jgi:outer membrane lipoprotein SlyB|nr:hypothetical protein [Fibromonadaceae bacterium]
MKKMLIALSMVAAVFTGCSSSIAIVSGNVSSENSGNKVTAEVSSVNILFLTPMSVEKAEAVVSGLSKQCNGDVVNITSHWQNTSYYILMLETLTATGYCK